VAPALAGPFLTAQGSDPLGAAVLAIVVAEMERIPTALVQLEAHGGHPPIAGGRAAKIGEETNAKYCPSRDSRSAAERWARGRPRVDDVPHSTDRPARVGVHGFISSDGMCELVGDARANGFPAKAELPSDEFFHLATIA
jgi:hypothetical protein